MASILRNKRAVGLILVLILALAVGGWYYLRSRTPEPVSAPALKTARVRTGDIVISASGSGTLVAAREANLGFKSSGRLVEILADVGATVEAGDPLVRLDDTDAKTQVAQAEIGLRLAEIKLQDLLRDPDAAAIAAARDNLTSAQKALDALLAGPSAQDLAIAEADLTLAEVNVQTAQAAYDRIAYRADAAGSKEAMALWQATLAYDKARASYEQRIAGASEEQLAAARAKVTSARSQLDNVLAGKSATDVETATLAVSQASNNLASARQAYSNTLLAAPFAGTVTAVRANVGEWVGTAPVVTVMATTPAVVVVAIEESDLVGVDVGDPVSVILNAMPEVTLSGAVTSIAPTVTSIGGVPAAEVRIELTQAEPPLQWLRVGMSTEVEITSAESRGTLLVPVEAVRELAPGSYAVFVVKEDNSLEMRVVQTGLRDFANVEILSGLARGDVVSTGTVATE